jgi:hypothetical protein
MQRVSSQHADQRKLWLASICKLWLASIRMLWLASIRMLWLASIRKLWLASTATIAPALHFFFGIFFLHEMQRVSSRYADADQGASAAFI